MRNQPVVGAIACITVGLVMTSIGIMLDPDMEKSTHLDTARLALPALLFAIYLLWLNATASIQRWAFALLASSLPAYVAFVNWLAIFTLTSYRKHHAPVIFLLSLGYLAFFFFMLAFKRKGANRVQEG